MKFLYPNSLAKTLDSLNEVFFLYNNLSKLQKEQSAKWIAGRQGMLGSYANMFEPTPFDYKRGVKLFTGEYINSGAAIGHILGEEACRALILLDVANSDVRNALKRASLGMMKMLVRPGIRDKMRGTYCCGTCTAALWRHLAVGGLKNVKTRLTKGIEYLRKNRDGEGRWRRFPFYYTLLALSEINMPLAIDEMRYSARICEGALKRYKSGNKIAKRRRILLERILAKV